MTVPRPYFPGREFVLHPKDIEAWGALLRDAFPDIRYYDDPPGHASENGSRPPDIRLRSTMQGGDRWVELVLDPDWKPRWRRVPTTSNRTTWILPPSPNPNARILLGGRIYDKARVEEGLAVYEAGAWRKLPESHYPPNITGGQIYFRCDKDKPEHMRVARKALRLIPKVATNKGLWVHYPSMAARPIGKGGLLWCGFHALDWCRQAPDRFLGYISLPNGTEGYGYRPLD